MQAEPIGPAGDDSCLIFEAFVRHDGFLPISEVSTKKYELLAP